LEHNTAKIEHNYCQEYGCIGNTKAKYQRPKTKEEGEQVN
jgi:hypothetical protein